MTILAALDLGSNSIKITVARRGASGTLEVLEERAEITRVGQGLDQTGRVSDEAAARTITGLGELAKMARGHGAREIACVATAGLRGAANAAEFLARVKAEVGIEVEIIGGLREAELAFRAASLAYGPGPMLVVDVGGRSTEIISGQGANIEARISLEIGSVRLTERFLAHDPPREEELDALAEHLAQELAAAPRAPAGAVKLAGVSGTVMSLMGVQLGLDDMGVTVERGEGAALLRESVRAAYDDLRSKTTPERIRGTVIPPGRADVIVAGARIVLGILEHYGQDAMIASNRGVRWGLLYELM